MALACPAMDPHHPIRRRVTSPVFLRMSPAQ
jgi:hypothetical protein